MQAYNYKNLHPDFCWQGKKRSKDELLLLAQTYCAEKIAYWTPIGQFFIDWFNDSSTITVQTSGSTGAPKKMRVKKQYMVNSAMATGTFFNLPANTTALLCMPATYIAGKLMLVRAMVLGWQLDAVQPQANPLAATTKNYDFCAVTPYQLSHMLKQLNRLKKVLVGGGAVSQALQQKIEGHTTAVYESYAMTETLTHIAARQINLKSVKNPPFQLMENVEISQDKQGCLIIKAPHVTDEIVHTHDIVKLQNSHSFWLKGRVDNVINSGGIKIHPEIIENKLHQIITQRFFVAGLPDETLGQKLVLIVEGQDSYDKREKMKQALLQLKNIGKYERPKEIYFTPKFVETHSGKIKRKETLAAATA